MQFAHDPADPPTFDGRASCLDSVHRRAEPRARLGCRQNVARGKEVRNDELYNDVEGQRLGAHGASDAVCIAAS